MFVKVKVNSCSDSILNNKFHMCTAYYLVFHAIIQKDDEPAELMGQISL